MFRFGLKNIRRLKDVEPVEIRRITLLVGRNSSGKSTFLRTFPLLRQSITTKTSSPILWFGDLVDYGSYENAVSDNDASREISFHFELDEVQLRDSLMLDNLPEKKFEKVGIEIYLQPFTGRQISRVGLWVGEGEEFVLHVSSDQTIRNVQLNGKEIGRYFAGWKVQLTSTSVLPDIFVFPVDDAMKTDMFFFARTRGLAKDAMLKRVGNVLPPDMDAKDQSEFVGELLGLDEFDANHLHAFAESTKHLTRRNAALRIANGTPQEFHSLVEIWMANHCFPLVEEVSRRLKRLLSEVLYIGPARATSLRYYRFQDLALSGIDPDGKNFPMFLNSLPEYQLNDFSDWVEKLFGYRIVVSPIPGHISIEVRDGVSQTNIVDTGYGVSQVLPVLGQIWWASNRRRFSFTPFTQQATSIVAIEQPELHLHPAHQALLADALAEPPISPIGQPNDVPSFVIETHSETLVNRLGQLVAEARLSRDDVQIVLFEADEEDHRKTNVFISRFGASGELINWPYGFFQASV